MYFLTACTTQPVEGQHVLAVRSDADENMHYSEKNLVNKSNEKLADRTLSDDSVHSPSVKN